MMPMTTSNSMMVNAERCALQSKRECIWMPTFSVLLMQKRNVCVEVSVRTSAGRHCPSGNAAHQVSRLGVVEPRAPGSAAVQQRARVPAN